MTFMAIDIAGGLFSVLSLKFRDDFDVAAGVRRLSVSSFGLPVSPLRPSPASWAILTLLGARAEYSPQVSYSLVVVLDSIVVILALVLNPIARKRRRREMEQTNHLANSEDIEVGRSSTVGQDASGAGGTDEKNARVMPMPDLSVEIPQQQRRPVEEFRIDQKHGSVG